MDAAEDDRLDRDLVEQAQHGDRGAFAILARTHGDRLMAIAQRILRDVGRAQLWSGASTPPICRPMPLGRESSRRMAGGWRSWMARRRINTDGTDGPALFTSLDNSQRCGVAA
jgi:hypothetical protein